MTSNKDFIETAFLAASLRQIWNEHANGIILITINHQVPKSSWDQSIRYFKSRYQEYFDKKTVWLSVIVSDDRHFDFYYKKKWILENTTASYLLAHLHVSKKTDGKCLYRDMILESEFFPRVDCSYTFFSKN